MPGEEDVWRAEAVAGLYFRVSSHTRGNGRKSRREDQQTR